MAYPLETKLQAFDLVDVRGMSVTAAADELGVSRKSVSGWVNNGALRQRWLARRGADAIVPEVDAAKPGGETAWELLFDAAKKGAPDRVAAAYAKVKWSVFRTWRQRADEGREPFSTLMARFDAERAGVILELNLADIDGSPGYQGREALRKAMCPDVYAERSELAVTVHDPMSRLSDDELQRVIEARESP